MPGRLAYRAVRRFLGYTSHAFFRQVCVVGAENIPPDGEPVLFCGNHPNSLVDPVLVITTCGRVVSFAAKDTLFRAPVMRSLLRALGAVPVARRMDHGAGQLDNTAAFDRLFDVLGAGGAMGIFPEGISHDESQLSRFKTGAARIALGVAARHPDRTVRIVPCGLTYMRRRRFRSRVLVRYGTPIEIDAEWKRAHAADERAAATDLTAAIERGLRGLTINAPDWETLRVLDGVRRLYQPAGISLADRVELARRFNEVYPKVREEPEVRSLLGRVSGYLERLEALGLDDRDLAQPVRTGAAVWRLLRHVGLLLFWLPLALPGAILHFPVGMLASIAGRRLTPRKDTVAATKLVAGIGLALVVYGAIIGLAAWRYGALAAVATLGIIAITGHASLRVADRLTFLRRAGGSLRRLLGLRAEVDALRAERAALEADVVTAVDRFRPADMAPLFPRSPPAEAQA